MASVQSEQYKKAVESPELTVTSAVLLAAARHLAEACRTDATNYMNCKFDNDGNPSACLDQGRKATECALNFFKTLRANCGSELDAQWQCLDKNNQNFQACRKTQSALDECVFEKMGLEGAFKTYDTTRSENSFQ